MPWMIASTITVSPNVTSSELNGLTRKRAKTHWIATPISANAGTMITSVASGSIDMRQLVAQIRREEREREMREVDLAQQAPGKAQPEAQQPVQRADEQSRENGLRKQRGTWKASARHGPCSVAPGAATDFGHTTTHLPFCTCLTRMRSSP